MTPELFQKIRQAIIDEIDGLLEEHEDGVNVAIGKKITATDPDKQPKIPLSFGVTLEPQGEACKVKVKISYGEKTSDESGRKVDTGERLPGMDDTKKHVKKFADGMAKAAGPGGSVEISGAGKTVKIEGK